MEFASLEARDYYLNGDPIHQKFKEMAKPTIEDVVVFDFTDGQFR